MYAIIQTKSFRYKKVKVENLGDVIFIDETRAFNISTAEAEREILDSSAPQGHKNFLLQVLPEEAN